MSSLIFVDEARPAIPKNIKLGWKCLPMKNTLAYRAGASERTKSFITSVPDFAISPQT